MGGLLRILPLVNSYTIGTFNSHKICLSLLRTIPICLHIKNNGMFTTLKIREVISHLLYHGSQLELKSILFLIRAISYLNFRVPTIAPVFTCHTFQYETELPIIVLEVGPASYQRMTAPHQRGNQKIIKGVANCASHLVWCKIFTLQARDPLHSHAKAEVCFVACIHVTPGVAYATNANPSLFLLPRLQ